MLKKSELTTTGSLLIGGQEDDQAAETKKAPFVQRGLFLL